MNKSKIEWTDRTWNPVTGCTKVSAGCKNCYAETMYERFNGKGSFKNIICYQDRLTLPLKWKKPSMVFVNSMSDLFHENVSFSFVYDAFLMMQKCKQHTFQILTKRPERMVEFFNYYAQIKEPIENIWIGVSIEDQKTADERIQYLNYIPAAVKFLSCEPLLGPVDFKKSIGDSLKWHAGGLKNCISWVIAGGESGHHARPMHPDWVISIRDQCENDGVPFFFKQWGEWTPECSDNKSSINKWLFVDVQNGETCHALAAFPEKNIQHHHQLMYRAGKKKAGSLLYGTEYKNYPKTTK